jgi:hypothetical protein
MRCSIEMLEGRVLESITRQSQPLSRSSGISSSLVKSSPVRERAIARVMLQRTTQRERVLEHSLDTLQLEGIADVERESDDRDIARP